MPRQHNHYATLGVTPTSTDAEITKEYRRLARIYHPDKNLNNKSSVESMLKLNEAYGVLKDSGSRRVYDRDCKLDGVQPANLAVPKTPPNNCDGSRKTSVTEENCEEIATEGVKEGKNEAAEKSGSELLGVFDARARKRERVERERVEGEGGERGGKERERWGGREERGREGEEREGEERVRGEWEEKERKRAEREAEREEIRKQREYKEAESREKAQRKQAEKDRDEEMIRRITQEFVNLLKIHGPAYVYGHQREHEPSPHPHYMPTSTPVQCGGTRWQVAEENYLLELCAQTSDWVYIKKMLNARFGRWRTLGACKSKIYRLRKIQQERDMYM